MKKHPSLKAVNDALSPCAFTHFIEEFLEAVQVEAEHNDTKYLITAGFSTNDRWTIDVMDEYGESLTEEELPSLKEEVDESNALSVAMHIQRVYRDIHQLKPAEDASSAHFREEREMNRAAGVPKYGNHSF